MVHRLLFLIPFAALACGYGGYSPTGGPGPLVTEPLVAKELPGFRPQELISVVVAPLDAPVGAPYSSEEMERYTKLLVEALDRETGLIVLNVSEAEQLAALQGKLGVQPQPLQTRALHLAREMESKGVIYGVLNRALPGAVSFRLWLAEAASGQPVWEAVYAVNDEALSENLFRLQQVVKNDGLRYRDTEERLRIGFGDAARSLEKSLRRE